MNEKQPWFVEERATALASLLLTNRKDVVVQPARREDAGFDLLAEVLKNGVSAGRFFGVQVAGRLELPSVEAINRDFRSDGRNGHAEFAIPLCAFLFDVRNNQGVYRWLMEPVLEDGIPKLDRVGDTRWARLDERTVNTIVDQVAGWYEALAIQLRA